MNDPRIYKYLNKKSLSQYFIVINQMRTTKIASVWPVGLVGGALYERPLVNRYGHVIGWDVVFLPTRRFAIDMAGFAINLRRLHERPGVRFRPKMYITESDFLDQLVTMKELEPKADNCTKVRVD